MASVVLRQAAIEDLSDIWDYTAMRWSEKQADKYYQSIKYACFEIGAIPDIGKEYIEISKSLLGFRSGKHILFYHIISEDEIEVIRILHERMDLKTQLTQ